jgi:hypothetical protein
VSDFESIAESLERIADTFRDSDIRDQIDMAARVRDLFKRVESLDKECSNALKDSTVLEIGRFVAGESFEVKLACHERALIDQKALREIRPDIAEQFGYSIQYEQLTFRAR